MLKRLLKKILPARWLTVYHASLACLAAVYYRFPSRRLIVIGITGTKGKTSTANFVWSVLQAGDQQTGLLSTANLRIGEREWLNPYHMTMPGRFEIQKQLAEMVRAGCHYAIIETTSEGLKQYRHLGVNYDIGIFTNLSPEHLQAHGGRFANYQKMKGRMFSTLAGPNKIIGGQKIPKVIIANADSEHAAYFLHFPSDQKISFSVERAADYQARDLTDRPSGVRFTLDGRPFELNILGQFNVPNALPAIIVGRLAGLADEQIATGLSALKSIPGRMELISNPGQNFTVIVDYAHEKQSMSKLLAAAQSRRSSGAQIILLLGAEGGGRDQAKRAEMGTLAGRLADQVIVSNVDPYDDDPEPILAEIAQAAEAAGKTRDQNLFVIADRRAGIARAFALARAGDFVLITGKGAEQSMKIGGQTLPWDDRQVVREELAKLNQRAPKTT